jgi:HlyD family secretion protein
MDKLISNKFGSDNSNTSTSNNGAFKAEAGAGMDRKIESKKSPLKKYGFIFVGLLLLSYLGYMAMDASQGRTFSIGESRVRIAKVATGEFEDFIPVRARVTPFRTVFLDAIEGGRVERRLVEDGTMVKEGQLIVELSNTSLQLDVMRNEAEVTQQLNNMRTIELQLEQNRLSHKRNLVEINYEIIKLERKVKRQRTLSGQQSISQSVLDDTEDELKYFKARLAVTLESQATDARLQETQMEFLQESGGRLEENLVFARNNMDKLNVRAPVAGKLSGLDVEIGQSIARGGRLGQIDDPNNFKLTANIDEYYLGRVDVGQVVSFDRDNTEYSMRINKIYPQVNNGQFEVDMVFTDAQPSGIRRGQTIQTQLTLSDSNQAVLIPNSAFYQDTGGNWIFVVSENGSEAVKRNVRLGRNNVNHIEVLSGLELGESVIISSYSSYKDMDRLKLTAQ